MTSLHDLRNESRPKQARKRVGRGLGSGLGKTCGRGQKGAGSRSGYKRRYGTEGGQWPLYRKVPVRGFTRGMFQKKMDVINLGLINEMFEDGETVSLDTLAAKRYLKGSSYGLKVLGDGTLTKKVKLEVQALSKEAERKLTEAGISFSLVD